MTTCVGVGWVLKVMPLVSLELAPGSTPNPLDSNLIIDIIVWVSFVWKYFPRTEFPKHSSIISISREFLRGFRRAITSPAIDGLRQNRSPRVWPGKMGCFTKQTRIVFWLVVYLPIWKIWKSDGIMTFPIYGKIKFMLQTTNQLYTLFGCV